MVMNKRMLMVVAKAPAAGQTKTRLGATIGMDAAAELFECLLLDTLDIVRSVPDITRAVAYFPPGSEDFFRGIAPDFELVLQQGDDLGARLDHVLTTCLNSGHTRVGVMSSDTPLVDPCTITQAFNALDDGYDVSLGPCDDGGYYLMAIKSPQPGILRPIRMSTSHVLQDTLDAAAQHNLCVAMLPTTSDVDTADDLARMEQQLAQLPAHVARRTREWLRRQSS